MSACVTAGSHRADAVAADESISVRGVELLDSPRSKCDGMPSLYCLNFCVFPFLSYQDRVVQTRKIRTRTRLTPLTPDVPNCCCSKGSAPYWSNPPFLIFDIRALWRSGKSARAPECQKLKMVR